MNPVMLPTSDEKDYYEIRLESIGGLGANLCGKMMGEMGLKYMGLNSAAFSSYGSEKTGTPVKSYIRYSRFEQEIRVHSPIKNPDLLAVFHEALLTDASALEGCGEQTILVVNTESGAERLIVPAAKEVYCVPAQKIAMETKARINVVMLGAMVRASGFLPLEAAERICEETLGQKYPQALPGNLAGIRQGYEKAVRVQGARRRRAKEKLRGGTGDAPEGGVNPWFGNSVISDLSASRQGYFPIFIKERCINCGLCDSTCPDMVFQFKKGIFKEREMMVNQGLDYYHCKGCLRCVSVCPVNALVRGVEAEHPDKKWFLPNQDMLLIPDGYEKAGPDGYITSESFLTEKRMEGGEV